MRVLITCVGGELMPQFLFLLKNNKEINHMKNCHIQDGIALTKLDVLDDMDEIKICVAYELDGKKLDIENFDMSNVEVKKGTTSELKRVFGKSMANRLVSRVVLNKFIQEVA